MKKKESGGRNAPPKPSRQKIFGNKSLKVSEEEDEASCLVGSIVEKGISEQLHNRPLVAPRPTLLPFPVARHRSHGPHWAPKANENSRAGGGEDDYDEGDGEDEGLAEFDPIAVFANPVQRKQKKGLDFSRWRELITSDNSSVCQKKDGEKHLLVEFNECGKVGEVTDLSDKINSHNDAKNGALSQKMLPNDNAKAKDVNMEEMDPALLEEMSGNAIAEISEEKGPGLLEVSKKQKLVDTEKQNTSTSHITSFPTSNNLGNEQGSVSLESQIDAENYARLQRMSTDEIAEAQAEILEKMNPALIEALRKRGQDKLKNQKSSSSSSDMAIKGRVDYIQDDKKWTKDTNGSLLSESDISHKLTPTASQDTQSGEDYNAVGNLKPGSSSLWDTWSERVEAVRELRFSFDGNVIENDFSQAPKAGNISVYSGYSADNVSERDFLRTEGDPGAAGYTIKEALALTRSVVPGQRALALHLLASVLDKALHNICRNQVGCNMKKANIDRFIDWEAIWAFAIGPEPELALSLRMSLDDNHNSVVLACAKVIQCTLSCDFNESFFNISEKIATYPKDVCTASVFRSRPEIDVGFLHGGFWKYSAKPSNILPFGEDIMDDKIEGEHTIQDDIVVAGQDFAAGLVRMGILPRILYLLETDPSVALEECLISILIAIARHSPTCANSIMKCKRLIQTVVDRFTMKDQMEIYPSKIKSVTLLKVLARSEKKNCLEFIKNGIFHKATWHLCRYAVSLDHWVKLGRENCQLSSVLVVEQLRFWKVCIQYGYCVLYFSDLFPALCMWLNVPSFEKLIRNNILSEFAAIAGEAYLVLEALTRRLPNFYSHLHLSNQTLEFTEEDMETWCWSHVGPMVDLAIKWTALRGNPYISEFFDLHKGNKSDSLFQNLPVSSLLWVISSVVRMLSSVLERVIPEDTISLPGGHVPWLPEFVPKIGLEIIKNGFLSFSGANGTEYGNNPAGSDSFIEYLCHLRHQSEHETSIASVCCLHGLIQLLVSVDKLIQLAKPEINTPSQGHNSSREGMILADGILKLSLVEFRSVLTTFMKLIASEWQYVQSIEIFGRGGPSPGVGLGWGASGGGFWSTTVLLAQTDAGLLILLLEIFQIVSANDLPMVEEMTFTMQRINSFFEVCLIVGPRDGFIVDKALNILLQVSVLKYLDLCIRHFLCVNKGFQLFGWEYKEEDYLLFSKILASHFRSRWLCLKKKFKTVGGNSCVGQKTFKKDSNSLDTIHEDLDTSNMTSQDHFCTSLVVEWAHQRLPLPMHWFLSPISTINDSKDADLLSASNMLNHTQDLTDFLEIAKGGLFFLLGIEAMSSFLSTEINSPVRGVPIIWKLHSLSVILLVRTDVLEEEKTRDVYKTLQEVYGQLLDESRSSKSTKFILEKNENLLAETREKYSVEFLRFQSEIHESYSTFMETFVEQFAALSYGDMIYGRQVAIYLHRCVEAPVRLAAWNALSNTHVLELLPPLENCFAEAEGYLEPVEDNESILEAYVKSWVSGALDKAATRGSVTFTLVLHHLSSFIFCCHTGNKTLLRNKLAKSLLRDYSRKQQHEGIMVDFIRFKKPPTSQIPRQEEEGSSLEVCEIERRFNLLTEACEGNSSLLREVEKLKSSLHKSNMICT
uniref:Transcriptional elongation regulator MINIYO n=1 Tax=Davidia involucrata TaxID=16924 RepID=A0A5B7BRB8_DAVIN